MTDEQLDVLIRSVEYDDAIDPAFVAASAARLLGHVRRARAQDASSLGRLGRDLRQALGVPGRTMASPAVRAVSLLALLILGLVAGLLIAGALHRATPFDMTEPRLMWHTRIAGEPESELADNHR